MTRKQAEKRMRELVRDLDPEINTAQVFVSLLPKIPDAQAITYFSDGKPPYCIVMLENNAPDSVYMHEAVHVVWNMNGLEEALPEFAEQASSWVKIKGVLRELKAYLE